MTEEVEDKLVLPMKRDEIVTIVEPHLASAKQTRNLVPSIVIDSNEQYIWTGKFLLSIKHVAAQVDERMKGITGPLQNSIRNVQALFQPTLDFLAEAEEIVKGKLLEWKKGIDDKRAEEAASGAQVTLAPAPDLTGVMYKSKWDFEIVTPEAVARQFCSPDRKKIQAHLDNGGLKAVPGVRFFEKDSVAASKKGIRSEE